MVISHTTYNLLVRARIGNETFDQIIARLFDRKDALKEAVGA
jgi:predicted CopG family antitoxin